MLRCRAFCFARSVSSFFSIFAFAGSVSRVSLRFAPFEGSFRMLRFRYALVSAVFADFVSESDVFSSVQPSPRSLHDGFAEAAGGSHRFVARSSPHRIDWIDEAHRSHSSFCIEIFPFHRDHLERISHGPASPHRSEVSFYTPVSSLDSKPKGTGWTVRFLRIFARVWEGPCCGVAPSIRACAADVQQQRRLILALPERWIGVRDDASDRKKVHVGPERWKMKRNARSGGGKTNGNCRWKRYDDACTWMGEGRGTMLTD